MIKDKQPTYVVLVLFFYDNFRFGARPSPLSWMSFQVKTPLLPTAAATLRRSLVVGLRPNEIWLQNRRPY